jgi:hypothetical protein
MTPTDFRPVLVTGVLGVVNDQIGIFEKLDAAMVTRMVKGWPPVNSRRVRDR